VQSAGFYTVLNANTWFASSRLRGKFFSLDEQSKRAVSAPAPELPIDGNQTTISLSVMDTSQQDHRVLRPVLVLLAAIALTWGLLLVSGDWPMN
jgi:hypothetical protein